MSANNLFNQNRGSKQFYSDTQLKVIQKGNNIGRVIGETYQCYSFWWNEAVPPASPGNPPPQSDQKAARLIKLGATKDKTAILMQIMDNVLSGDYIPNPTGKGFGTMNYHHMAKFPNLIARWDSMKPARAGLVNWIDRGDSIYHSQTKASKKLVQTSKAIGIGGGIIKGIGAVLQQNEAQFPNIDMYDINIYKQVIGTRPQDTSYMVMPTDNRSPLTDEERAYKLFNFEDELSVTPNISILEVMYGDIKEVDTSFNTNYLEMFFADIQNTINNMTTETNKKVLEIRLMRAKDGKPVRDYNELSKIIEGVKARIAGTVPAQPQSPNTPTPSTPPSAPQNQLFSQPEEPNTPPPTDYIPPQQVAQTPPPPVQPTPPQSVDVPPPQQNTVPPPAAAGTTMQCPVCLSDIPKNSAQCPKCKVKLQ